MRCLLDTHALIWYFQHSPRLSNKAISLINDPTVKKYVSVASMWEFAIKQSKNKLKYDVPHMW